MIADTSFIIDILRGRKEAAEKIKGFSEPIKTTSISVFECLGGMLMINRSLSRLYISLNPVKIVL